MLLLDQTNFPVNHFLPCPWIRITTHILSHCPPLQADFGCLKNNLSEVHAATGTAGTSIPAADWSVFRINHPTPVPRASARGTELSQLSAHSALSPPRSFRTLLLFTFPALALLLPVFNFTLHLWSLSVFPSPSPLPTQTGIYFLRPLTRSRLLQPRSSWARPRRWWSCEWVATTERKAANKEWPGRSQAVKTKMPLFLNKPLWSSHTDLLWKRNKIRRNPKP